MKQNYEFGSVTVNLVAKTEEFEKQIEQAKKTLKTLDSISAGRGLENYFLAQEELVERLTKAYKEYIYWQDQDTAEELIKSAHALQAMTGELSSIKHIDGLGDISKELAQVEKQFRDTSDLFSADKFRDVFEAIYTVRSAGLDVNEVFEKFKNQDTDALTSRIRDLESELEDATEAAKSLRAENSRLADGTAVELYKKQVSDLNTELTSIKNRAASTFRGFLTSNGLNAFDEKYSNYFKEIREGGKSALQVMAQFRAENKHLFENVDGGEALSSMFQVLLSTINQVEEGVKSLASTINEMNVNGVKTVSDAGTGSMRELASALLDVNQAAGGGGGDGPGNSDWLRVLIEKLTDFATIDVNNLSRVATSLSSIASMNGLSITKTPINNITVLLDALKTFGKDGRGITIPDFSKLNNLAVDENQLKTLSSYLPKIAKGDYAGLHELEGITFDNLKNLSLENSVASIKAIASLTRALNGSDLSSANAFLTGLDFSKIQNVGVDEKLGAFATALSQLSKVPFDPLKNILSLSFQNLNSIDIKENAAQSIESLANSMSSLSSAKQELKDIIDFISQYQASAASARPNSPLVPPSVPSQISNFDKIRQSYSGLSEDQDNLQSELRETSSALSDCILKWQEIETYTKNESTGQNDISSQQLIVVRDYKALAELKERNEEKSRKEAIAINDLQRAYEKYAAVLEKTSNAAKGAGMSGNSDLTELDTLRAKLDSLIKNIATASPDELKQIQVEFSKLHKEADAAQTSVGKALNAIKDNAKADEAARRELITVNDLQDAYGKYAESLNKSIKQAEEAGLIDDDRVKTLRALRDEVGKLAVGLSTADSQGIKDAQLEFSELHKNADIAKRSVDSAVESIRKTERASEATQRETNSMNRLAATIDAYIAKLKESKQAAIDAGVGEDSRVKSLDNTIDAFEKLRKSMDSATPPNYEDVNSKYLDMRVGAEEARRSVDDLATAQSNLNTQQEKESADTYKAIARYEAVRKQIINDISKSSKAENGASATDYQALLQYRENVEQLFNEYNSGAKSLQEFRDGLEGIANGASGAANNIRQAGEMTMSFGDRIKKAMGNLSAYFGVSRVIMQAVRYTRDLIKTSIELDKEMGQLRIVTDETEDSYSKFSESTAKTAKEISASMTDLISATTTFARLGYSLDDSSVLAKYTAMLQQVGDIDASAAQDAVTAITKAFSDEVDISNIESVMDRLVTVGNGFPISVAQIAEGMNNASSALSAAGNNLNESIALLAAANVTVQNASKSSTALRTITARLRNSKAELDELGEEVMTTAKYQELLNTLTDNHVDIIDKVTKKYNSTYEIMRQLSEVWDDLDGGVRAALTTQLAGVRNVDVFNSILTNFKETAVGAMDAMENSAGTLSDAYDEYLNTAAAHINSLKAAWQGLSTTVVDSGFINFVVDGGKMIVEVLSAIFNILNQLGGIWTISAVGAGVLISKFMGVMQGVSAFRAAFASARLEGMSMFSSLAAGAEGFASKLNMTRIAIAGILAAYGLLISIMQEQAKARDEAIKAGREAAKLADSVVDVEAQYKQLHEAGDLEGIKSLQEKITNLVGEQADGVDLVNGKYDEQLKKLKDITYELSKDPQHDNELKSAYYSATSGYYYTPRAQEFEEEERTILELIDETRELWETQVAAHDLSAAKTKQNLDDLTDRLQKMKDAALDIVSDVKLEEVYDNISDSVFDSKQSVDEFISSLTNFSFNADIIDAYDKGLITLEDIEETVRRIIAQRYPEYIDLVYESTEEVVDALEEYESALTNLDVHTDDIKEAYDIIGKAAAEMERGDGVSYETLKALMKMTDNYTKYLYESNGQLMIRTDLLKQEADASLNAIKAEISLLEAEYKHPFDKPAPAGKVSERRQEIQEEIDARKEELKILEAVYNTIELSSLSSPFKKQLEEHQHMIAMEKETTEEYIEWLKVASKEAYDSGWITFDEYRKYEEEVYKSSPKLADSLKNLGSAYDTIAKAREEYEETGKLSVDTIESIISSTDKYADVLDIENGEIKLNEEAWIDYYTTKFDLARRDVIAQRDALESTRDQLESERDLLDSMGYNTDAIKANITTISAEIAELDEKVSIYDGLVDKVGKKDFSDIWDNLSGYLSEVSSLYEAMAKAREEMSNSGRLSFDTVESLLSISPDYIRFLRTENGQITLNADALRDYADAKEKSRISEINEEISKLQKQLTEADKAGESGRVSNLQEEINGFIKMRDVYESMLESAKETTTLSDAISDLGKSYDILLSAQSEMAETGKLSISTIESIISATDNYAKILKIENGEIKLNEQAWQEYYSEKYNAAKEELAVQLELLEARKSYLASEMGAFTSEEDQINKANQIAELDKQITETTDKLKLYDALLSEITKKQSKDVWEDLSDSVSKTSSAYDLITTAQQEMADSSRLSVETVKSILSLSPEYVQFLEVEGGMIKLNAEAMRDYAKARSEAKLAEIDAEITSRRQEMSDYLASGDMDNVHKLEAEISQLLGFRDVYEVLSKQTAEVYSLSDAISELTSKHKLLAEARKEMAENGKLSVGTIESIMAATENYTDVLSIENGEIKLNEQAWEEYYTNKYNAAKKDLEATQESLRQTREAQQAELASIQTLSDQWAVDRAAELRESLAAIGLQYDSNAEKIEMFDIILGKVTEDVDEQKEVLSTYISRMKDALSDVSNTYDAIDKAQKEMRESGYLSAETVESLLSISPEYINFLETEGSLIKLNADALREYAEAQYAKKISEISDEVATLKTRLEELKNKGDTEGAAAIQSQIDALESEILVYQNLMDSLTDGASEVGKTTTFINDMRDSLSDLADVQAVVANGFVVTADKVKALAETFPELFENAEAYADGSMKLDSEVATAFLENRQNEANATIDSRITELQAELEAVTAKKDLIDAEIKLAMEAAQSEAQIDKDVAQYRINNADTVAQKMIDAGVAESEAYAIAAQSIYDNTFDLDTAIAKATSDIANNYGSAFASAADNSYVNSNAMNTNIATTAAQAQQAALAVAGMINGKVQGSSNVIKPGVGGSRINSSHMTSIGGYTDSGTGNVQAMMQGVINALRASNVSLDPATFAATYFKSVFQGTNLADLVLAKIDESNVLADIQAKLSGQIAILEGMRKTDLSAFRDKDKTKSSSAGKGGSPSTSGTTGTSGAKGDNPFELMYKEHQHLLKMEQESVGDYFAWLDKASKDAFAQGWITLDDLRKYEEEVYSGLKEILKDAESAMNDLVKFRVKMLEREREDQKDALQAQLAVLKNFYDEQKKQLQDQREEEEYQKEKAEKQKAVTDIEAELAMLGYDNSAKAQKRRLELQQQLAEAQAAYAEFENDHAYQLAEDALESAYEKQSAELQAQIDAIDAVLNDPNALFNQALEDIRNDTGSLYEEMVKFAEENGEGESTVKRLWENAFIATQDLQKVTSENVQTISELLRDLPSDIAKLITGFTMQNSTGYSYTSKDSTASTSAGSSTPGSSSASGGGSSGKIPVGTAVRATGKAYSTVKGTGNAVDVTGKQLYVAQVWDNAANPYWQGDYTYAVAYSKGGSIIGWVRKDQLSGYASGTSFATAGMHRVDEKGQEALFVSANGNHYRLLSDGDKVFNAEATDFLYRFANGDKDIFKDIFSGIFSKAALNNIANRQSIGDVRMGDIIINGNTDKATVSEIRRAQRESVDSLLQQFGRLQRAAY